MNLIPWLRVAGLLLLLLVASTFFAPKILRYRENLERIEPIVREVFQIHNLYITFYIGAFAVLALAYPEELATTSMGRFLAGFAGITWLLRLAIQFFYHNAEIKRAWPLMNVFYSLTFLYLGLSFGAVAVGLGR